jgi:proteic killer suppression protein
MLSPDRIRSRNLKRLAERGPDQGIRAEWRPKAKRILAALHVATSPEELDLPGYGWHRLLGDRKGTYSVVLSRNGRITCRWDDEGSYDVDLEDYHG